MPKLTADDLPVLVKYNDDNTEVLCFHCGAKYPAVETSGVSWHSEPYNISYDDVVKHMIMDHADFFTAKVFIAYFEAWPPKVQEYLRDLGYDSMLLSDSAEGAPENHWDYLLEGATHA